MRRLARQRPRFGADRIHKPRGLQTDQVKRLKALENENARLERLLADAKLDKTILKEAASGNF